MAAPLIPFPIFPPYEHWHPNASIVDSENQNVRRRLDEVNPTCLPIMSVWYCANFLENAAHHWAPGQAKHLYGQTCRHLEQMLNWSFLNDISLLDLDHQHFREFLEFLSHPPRAWCSSAIHAKYLATPHRPFRDWGINEKWHPFFRNIGDSGASGQSRRDLQRSAQIAKDFFDFYISKTGLVKINCAAIIPEDILNGLARSRPLVVHRPHELDWAFHQLMDGLIPVLRSEQILLYMAIARFTVLRIEHVRNLSQFYRAPNGGWSFDNRQRSAVPIELSSEFSYHMERYLSWYQIGLNEELPSVPLFPTNDGTFGYSVDVLHKHMEGFRDLLAVAASGCEDPEIARSEAKFRCMTFASIRRSSSYSSKSRFRNSRRQKRLERAIDRQLR